MSYCYIVLDDKKNKICYTYHEYLCKKMKLFEIFKESGYVVKNWNFKFSALLHV